MTTVLTGVMILGLLTMIGLFVIRFWGPGAAPAPTAADLADPAVLVPALNLALPPGETVQSVTMGPEWRIVVTGSGRVLIFDAAGAIHSEASLPPAALPTGVGQE